ncbi:MAG: RNA polymerase sigma factor [bacterium]|nr:RNA polymerase sigma factor [bacterium]
MRKTRLTEFFRAEYVKLVRSVRRWIDDTSDRDAEDIVQDVMMNMFDKADFTIPIENLTAFVYRSLKNRVVDVFRRQSKRSHISLDAQIDEQGGLSLADLVRDAGESVESEEEKRELYTHLYGAIDGLKEKEQEVVIATEFEGASFRKLSEEWGVPMGTLLARKARALKKIKQALVDTDMPIKGSRNAWKEE